MLGVRQVSREASRLSTCLQLGDVFVVLCYRSLHLFEVSVAVVDSGDAAHGTRHMIE